MFDSKQRSIAWLVQSGTLALAGKSDSVKLDAELILAHLLNAPRMAIIARGNELVTPEIEASFAQGIKRRAAGEPIAYIISEKEFWSLAFEVSPQVLVPRPDTEIVVERALEVIADRHSSGPNTIADLGCGSGCIGIAIAHELRARGRLAHVVCVDISCGAMSLTKRNAERHSLNGLISFVQGDWLSAFRNQQIFDLVVSNPPYVSKHSQALPVELSYEPRQALFADDHGLSALKHLILSAPSILRKAGTFLSEIGHDQAQALMEFVDSRRSQLEREMQVRIHRDLAGKNRVLEIGVS